MSTGAAFARGASKQDYSTPQDFLAAVKKRFGMLTFDLAATRDNAVTTVFFGLPLDSLKQDWTKLYGNLWLNPPFDKIEPWACKCAESVGEGRNIFFLVPAAVGSNWYARHVHEKAMVCFLNGRLSFDGKAPFPKDCLLACYGLKPGYECWRWK